MDPIFPPTKHKVGSLVFLPNEKRDGTFEHVTKGYYYKVTGHTTDEMNSPQCKLLHLKTFEGRIRYAAAHTTDKFHKVTSHSSVLYLRPRTVEEIECEVDLLNVQYTTLTVNTTYSPQSPQWKKTQCFKTVYLITPHNSIQTTLQQHVGPTQLTALQTHQETVISAQYRDDNGNIYTTLDTKATARCPACSHTGADTRCTTHSECEGWFFFNEAYFILRLIPHTVWAWLAPKGVSLYCTVH